MTRRALALAFLVLPTAAEAHAFKTGQDTYSAFLEGNRVILATPSLILPLLALGLALAMWKTEGLLKAWPWFLGGQIVGMVAAPLVGPWVALVPMSFGLVLGAFAALVPLVRFGGGLPVLAALTGAAVMAAALEGHAVSEIGIAIRFGLFFAVNIVTAFFAGIVRAVHERWPGQVVHIGFRVAASWVAAILVLYLAFAMVGETLPEAPEAAATE